MNKVVLEKINENIKESLIKRDTESRSNETGIGVRDDKEKGLLILDIKQGISKNREYVGNITVDVKNKKINLIAKEVLKDYYEEFPIFNITCDNGNVELNVFNEDGLLYLYDDSAVDIVLSKIEDLGYIDTEEYKKRYTWTCPRTLSGIFIKSYVSETLYEKVYEIYKVIGDIKPYKESEIVIYDFLDFIQYMCRKFARLLYEMYSSLYKYKDEIEVEFTPKELLNILVEKSHSSIRFGTKTTIDGVPVVLINKDEEFEYNDKKYRYGLHLDVVTDKCEVIFGYYEGVRKPDSDEYKYTKIGEITLKYDEKDEISSVLFYRLDTLYDGEPDNFTTDLSLLEKLYFNKELVIRPFTKQNIIKASNIAEKVDTPMTVIATGEEENLYGVRLLGFAEYTFYIINKIINNYGINTFKQIATAKDKINFII